MLSDVESRLKNIKDHFNKILEEALAEIQNTLVFHKTQNMANLKDLEKDLNSLKQKEKKKPPKGIIFDMYTDDSLDNLFEFMNGFKEEFFGMILSKCILKGTEEMKDVLIKFKLQYLNNLVQGPLMFPSELFRYFEKEVTRKIISPSKNYGKVISAVSPSSEFSSEFTKNLG